MALIELAKVIADDPAASRRWAAEPLPPSDRLSAVLTSRFATLPEPARAALLRAAVADGLDLRAAASHGAEGLLVREVRAGSPAARAGLAHGDLIMSARAGRYPRSTTWPARSRPFPATLWS